MGVELIPKSSLQTLTNLVPTSKSPQEKRESFYRLINCHNSSRRPRKKKRISARRQLKEADSSLWRLCNSSWWMTQMTWSKVWAGSCRKWATPVVSKIQSTADLTCGHWCREAWQMSFRFSTGSFKRICSQRYLRISFWEMPRFSKWITKREPNTKKKLQTSSESNKWAVIESQVPTKTNSGHTMIVKCSQLKKQWDSEAIRRSAPTVLTQRNRCLKRKLKNRSPLTNIKHRTEEAFREKVDMFLTNL